MDGWIDHLENKVVPELDSLNDKIKYEQKKIELFMKSRSELNEKIGPHVDLTFTLKA